MLTLEKSSKTGVFRMSDTHKIPGVITPAAAHHHQKPMSVAESVAAHFKREADIKARAERDGDAYRAEIRERLAREFIGPIDQRRKATD